MSETGTETAVVVDRPRPAEPTTVDLARSLLAYRSLHELPLGPFPQRQGLLPDGAQRALADPRSVAATIRWGDAELDEAVVPVLTPVDLVDWYSPEYRDSHFHELLAAGATGWHLSTFPGLDDLAFDALLSAALDRLDETAGPWIIFADHADRSDDPTGRRIASHIADAAPRSTEVNLSDDGPVREHYLAGVLEVGPGGRLLHPLDLRTTVSGPITDPEFLDELWDIYEPPFRRLASRTPLRTYFERRELEAAASSSGAVHVRHRDQGHLVSWLMMTTDFSSFPWLDADAFREIDPQVPADCVHVFPGLVTDEHFRGNHCAEKLINEGTFWLEQLGPRHLIVFETLDENVGFLPELIEAAVASTGYGELSFRPVGAQVLRAWCST